MRKNEVSGTKKLTVTSNLYERRLKMNSKRNQTLVQKESYVAHIQLVGITSFDIFDIVYTLKKESYFFCPNEVFFCFLHTSE